MYKQSPKSPLMKALIGKQKNLPEALKAKIMAAPESPAKAMEGPGIPKEANKTGTAGANSAKGKNASAPDAKRSYAPGTQASKFNPAEVKPKASSSKKSTTTSNKKSTTASKPKYDKELNSLVAQRKGLKKGTAEYNRVQNRINEKLGSKVRRSTEEAVKLKPKSGSSYSKNTRVEPAAKKPAVKKQSAADKQAASFEADLAKQNAKAPMGSERGSKAPAAKPAAKKPVAKKPVAAKKPAAKKTAGQKVKGAVRKARLAQLDRKANRQEARGARKAARKTARADKLREKADRLSSPAKQVNTKKVKKAAKTLAKSAIGPGGVAIVKGVKKVQANKKKAKNAELVRELGKQGFPKGNKSSKTTPSRTKPIGGPVDSGLSKESKEKMGRLLVKANRKASGRPPIVRTPAKKYKK